MAGYNNSMNCRRENMSLSLIVLSIFMLLSCFNIYFNLRRMRKGIMLTKPFLMPVLLFFYLASAVHSNWMLCAALICGFLGDVLLMKEGVYFILGLLSFLLGHIFYILTFTTDVKQITLVAYFTILPYAVTGVLISKKLLPSVKELKAPIIIYMAAILMMSFTSVLRFGSVPSYSSWLTFTGSVFFIISDTILAFNEFKGNITNNGVYVMTTYLLAQLLIVSGFIPW